MVAHDTHAAGYTRVNTREQNTSAVRVTTPTCRTVLYIRVSTDDQAKEGNSLADQERAGRLMVASHVAMGDEGWTEIVEGQRDVYADPGVSGAARDRPGLNRLMADAKAGKIGRVVCTKLDRMSRRAADLLAIEDAFDRYGVQRTYIKDSIDTSTPTGRLLRTVLAAVAELERDLILERTMAGKVEAIRKGLVWRSNGILGYHCLPSDKETGQRGRLEIDEATAPLVRRIFAAVASGVSCRALAAQLNAEGVPTVGDGTMWRHNTIQRIITNPAYTGRAAYGRQRRAKVRDGGTDAVRSVVRRGDPDQILYAEVPAIVTPALAQAAQAAMARNRVISARNTKRDYLLGGGLVLCGATLPDGRPCLSVMRGEDHRGVTYRCNHQEPEGARRHTIKADVLDGAVWDALRGLILDPDTVLAEVEAAAEDGGSQVTEAATKLERVERTLGEVEKQRARLLDLYLQGHLDASAYAAKVAEFDARRDALAVERDAFAVRRDEGAAQLIPTGDVRAACAHLSARLDALTFGQRQHLVRTLVERVTATREHAVIEGVFDAPAMGTANTDGTEGDELGGMSVDGTIADRTSRRCGRRRRRLRGRA